MKKNNALTGIFTPCVLSITKKLSLSLFIFAFTYTLLAQNKPFPQQNDWANCIKPNVSQAQLNADVAAFYDTWKSQYLRTTNMAGGYYVHGECTGCTEAAKGTSEGHGWGMLITVLMAGYDSNAKTYFDGFYKYFDQHRSPYNNELMSWMVENSENGGEHTATDGDLDIAYALLLAHDQWGSNGSINYLQEAKDMITSGIKVSDMNVSTQRVMLGTWDTDGNSTRSSDWMTAQFRAYQEATGDSFWNGAINTAYSIMNTIQSNYSSSTGLMPDFVTDNSPKPANPFFLESANDGDYNWNACRFPWRVAMDYAHYGNTNAKTVVNKIVNWAKSETGTNPSNYIAGYTLDGNPLVSYTSNAFTSPLIVASIVDASHQNFLDSGWDLIKNSYYSYYDASINMLCMLVISGNWWVPQPGGTTNNNLTVSSLNSFSSNGGSQSISVSSNVNWTVSENSSWVSVNTTSGSNNGTVNVTVSANTSSSSRSATITISGSGITRSVTVTQAGSNSNPITFTPDPNKIYYIDVPHHNLRLASDGQSEDPYTTATSTTGADVEWKFVDKGNGYWHIERVAGGSKPRLRSDNSANADMNPSSSSGSWTYYDFTEGASNNTYFITLPAAPANFKRLQVNNNGEVKLVSTSSNGTWESFSITEASSGNSNTNVNLALNGSASQSTTAYSGAASRAIDGDTNGNYSNASVTHTSAITGSWWQVVLNQQTNIGDIVIYNRTNSCCTNRLSNFTVTVLNNNNNQVFSQTVTQTPNPSITINAGGASGRTVIITTNLANTALSLAEVEVYGSNSSKIDSKKETIDNHLAIKAYPNPFVDAITVSLNNNNGTTILRLIDISGKLIRETSTNANIFTINNLDNLERGIYFLQITNSKNQIIQTKKMVK